MRLFSEVNGREDVRLASRSEDRFRKGILPIHPILCARRQGAVPRVVPHPWHRG